MIDIHAHILPGVDDGAEKLDSALEMATLAVESGVTTVVATPHCVEFSRQSNLWGSELIHRIRDFQQALNNAGIPLEILPGMEIFGTENVPALLRKKRMIGLNESRYPLVEFPFYNYAGPATEILEEILELGMRPVVAHPERYQYVQEDPTILNLWVQMGCLLQINKGSLLGRFGPYERRLAFELVDRGFAFAVASDAHSPMVRTTWMQDVDRLLREEFSGAAAEVLLERNPQKLLHNETIRWSEPHWFR